MHQSTASSLFNQPDTCTARISRVQQHAGKRLNSYSHAGMHSVSCYCSTQSTQHLVVQQAPWQNAMMPCRALHAAQPNAMYKLFSSDVCF